MKKRLILLVVLSLSALLSFTSCAKKATVNGLTAGAVVPTTRPAAPTLAETNVISLYTSSNTYTNAAVANWNPDWGQGGSLVDATIDGASVKKLDLVNYQGVSIDEANGINITGKTTLHMNVWTADGTPFNVYAISGGADGPAISTGDLIPGQWNTVEINCSGAVDITKIIQLKFDGGTGKTYYIDNIYFKEGGITPPPVVPATRPAAPTLAETNVISLHTSSNTYTNTAVADWNPGWGQGGSLVDATIDGATVKRLYLVNYQGVSIDEANGINITGKTTLHMNVWTADGTPFNVYAISGGADGPAISTGDLIPGQWNTVEINCSGAVDITKIIQLKFDGGTSKIYYIDNIYFY